LQSGQIEKFIDLGLGIEVGLETVGK